ncbi:MAG: phosphate signaling complex protein PhoU [Candidatus Competibacteraceae bacterium]|jgi:phosphate transport system protein|nr:phosphate signaling complex protein PhoU [Candidatus Competibacteraceae bacterium]
MVITKDEHTVKSYDQDLSNLRNLVLEMGGLVEDQINRALKALDDEDLTAARDVIAKDQAVNAMHLKADEESVNLLALRQPLGSDLRSIMSLAKTANDLERIGDEAEKVARMVVHIYDSPTSPPSNRLFRDVMSTARLAVEMLRGSLDALARLDVEKALTVAKRDAELDREFQSALRYLITYMMEDVRTIGHAINVIFMIKSLERIGDHAKNIAEYVIYLVKGTDIRHASVDDIEQGLLSG